MTSELHAHRLDVVAALLVATGARSVLDLGCGPGELIERLLPHAHIDRIVGIDASSFALQLAGRRFAPLHPRVEIHQANYAAPDHRLAGFDAAALVETIEHVDAHRLGAVEAAVFGTLAPTHVVITTPNAEYNPLHGLSPGERRHADHRFEWDRARFRAWARRIAGRYGYRTTFHDIGDSDPVLGASTQMACFKRASAPVHSVVAAQRRAAP